jgi:hypothetical protein
MKNELTKEQRIAKLPAWAQEKLKTSERERSYAMERLAEFLDHQTPSKIFVERMLGTCTGELRPCVDKVYIQGESITFEHAGVRLRVSIYDNNTGRDCIHLQWEDVNRLCREVAMVPLSLQYVKLISKETMR